MSSENPYQSPAEVPVEARPSPEQTRLARNIRAICILYAVFGSVAVLAGIGLFFDDTGAVPRVVPCIVLPLGLGGLVSAVGVLRKRAWGVPLCRVMSALYLLSFPIGTILGAYFLLNIGKVKDMFR